MSANKIVQRQSTKLVIRKIDFVFYHEAEIRRAVEMNPSAARMVIDGVEIERPANWLAVIENAYAHFEKNKKPHYAEAARQRYSGKYYQLGASASGLKKSQFYYAIDAFRTMAMLYAVQLRLLSTDEFSTR